MDLDTFTAENTKTVVLVFIENHGQSAVNVDILRTSLGPMMKDNVILVILF